MTGTFVEDAIRAGSRPAHLCRVEAVMGTTFTIDVRDPDVDPTAIDRAFGLLRAVDRRFSMWLSDSEVRRIARGEIRPADASPDVQEVFLRCEELTRFTDGAFDMRYRRDGTCDPTGFVKGWALEGAAALLARGGARNFAINGGGDVVARGEASPGRRWRLGIRHPEHRDLVAAVLEVRDAAIATSGTYERGNHIVDPVTGAPITTLASTTVVGPSIALADAYATAAFVMGSHAVQWLAALDGYVGCAITTDGRLWSTPGFERLRVA